MRLPTPGQHRKYSRDKRRFRGSIKAEMRRFFAKNIPAARISRHGDGASTGSLENPFADWLMRNPARLGISASCRVTAWKHAMQSRASGEPGLRRGPLSY